MIVIFVIGYCLFLGLLDLVISRAERGISRRALWERRRWAVRLAGATTSENAGMSNEMAVRICHVEISKVSSATLFVRGLGDPNTRPRS